MKLMMVNASPRNEGNTSRILEEMKKIFEEEGVEVVSFDIGKDGIRSCIACNSCHKSVKCVFDDAVNKAAPVFEEADGILVRTRHSWLSSQDFSTAPVSPRGSR